MSVQYQSLQACFLRVVVLDDDGSPLTGPSSVYTTDAFLSIENSLVVKEGDSFQAVNGCGSVCASYEDCDRIQATEGTLNLCALDAELVVMLTGAALLVDQEGDPVGFAVPEYNAVCPNGVSIEVWTKAWNGNQPAVSGADRLYYRHVWPQVRGRLGNTTLENAVLQVPVSIKGAANSVLTGIAGPFGDWPDEVGASPYAVFLDPGTPDLTDGPAPWPPAPDGGEFMLREDGGFMLREDGGFMLRET